MWIKINSKKYQIHRKAARLWDQNQKTKKTKLETIYNNQKTQIKYIEMKNRMYLCYKEVKYLSITEHSIYE